MYARLNTIACALIGVFLVGVATVQAVPINLTQGYPDIVVSSNTITYNAATQVFTATGRPLGYSADSSTTSNITGTTTASYSLSATISNAGAASTGALTVGGKIASLGATSGTLLTGAYQNFGYSSLGNGDPFEFIFSVTGGDLASYYGGIGGKIGVIISAKSVNFVNFAGSFTGTSGATNDTFSVVPEPASCCLLALAGLVAFRRRASR